MNGMIGYKALRGDFTAHNCFKYEIGKTYELPKDEKLEICHRGFHFCANPIDVYGYYLDYDNTIIVEVEALGEIVQEGTKYATDKIKINRICSKEEMQNLIASAKNNSGDYNTGNFNTGHYNSGHHNSGDFNSGHCNRGDRNSGDCNTGNNNIGSYNTGNNNTGKHNSGDNNNGNYNSGYLNDGCSNTGHYNDGDYNTGNYNIGYYNTGIYNTGDYNTGIFNTNEPLMRAFNKDTDMTFNSFIDSINYSFDELCERIYNNKLRESDREKIEALPNYDPEIFTKITGIKFDDDNDEAKETIAELNDEIDSLLEEIELRRKRINELKTKSN